MGLSGRQEGEGHDRAVSSCETTGRQNDVLGLPGCQLELVRVALVAMEISWKLLIRVETYCCFEELVTFHLINNSCHVVEKQINSEVSLTQLFHSRSLARLTDKLVSLWRNFFSSNKNSLTWQIVFPVSFQMLLSRVYFLFSVILNSSSCKPSLRWDAPWCWYWWTVGQSGEESMFNSFVTLAFYFFFTWEKLNLFILLKSEFYKIDILTSWRC